MLPALIGERVHVAVITGKIAPALYFKDKFPEWDWSPSQGVQILHVKSIRPFRKGSRRHNHPCTIVKAEDQSLPKLLTQMGAFKLACRGSPWRCAAEAAR